MTLNFGNNLFPPRGEVLVNYDWQNVLNGQGVIIFYGGLNLKDYGTQESYESGDDATISVSDGDYIAQTFTPSEDIWLENIELYVGNFTSDYDISIQETTSDKPNGTILYFQNQDDDIINFQRGGETNHWQQFSFTNQIKEKLSANTKYAIVLKRTDNSNYLSLRVDESSPTYTGGCYLTSSDGTTWSEDTGTDILFKVNGETSNPYILSTEEFTPSKTSSFHRFEYGIDKSDFSKIYSFEFETPIAVSMIMLGQGIINISELGKEGSTTEFWAYTEIELIRDRNGNETTIFSGKSKPHEYTGTTSNPETISFEITTPVKLNVGDKIKLKFDGYLKTFQQLNQTNYLGLNHNGTSNLKLQLPFKINI